MSYEPRPVFSYHRLRSMCYIVAKVFDRFQWKYDRKWLTRDIECWSYEDTKRERIAYLSMDTVIYIASWVLDSPALTCRAVLHELAHLIDPEVEVEAAYAEYSNCTPSASCSYVLTPTEMKATITEAEVFGAAEDSSCYYANLLNRSAGKMELFFVRNLTSSKPFSNYGQPCSSLAIQVPASWTRAAVSGAFPRLIHFYDVQKFISKPWTGDLQIDSGKDCLCVIKQECVEEFFQQCHKALTQLKKQGEQLCR